MIYATGDLHGKVDIKKLGSKRWLEGRRLTRDDYLVILGDFGLVWSWSTDDLYWLDWLEERPWTTLWIDGNHENFDIIEGLSVEDGWHGGRIQRVPGREHIIHLMRGEVYDLPTGLGDTVRCFCMGGATSIDREWRREGVSWWPQEMPSVAEYENATANLERVEFKVDYVFTHDCSSGLLPYALLWDYTMMRHDPPADQLQGFLQWVDERLDHDRLRRWYFGHHHRNEVCRDEKHVMLYDQILELGELPYEEEWV